MTFEMCLYDRGGPTFAKTAIKVGVDIMRLQICFVFLLDWNNLKILHLPKHYAVLMVHARKFYHVPVFGSCSQPIATESLEGTMISIGWMEIEINRMH